MAYDKLCDSAFLDAGLKQIADAIREKGGTSDNLAFPTAMAEAIAAIEAGGGGASIGDWAIQSGTFTPSENITSNYTINLDEELAVSAGSGRCIGAFWLDNPPGVDQSKSAWVWSILLDNIFSTTGASMSNGCAAYTDTYGNVTKKTTPMSEFIATAYKTLTIPCTTSKMLIAGNVYRWITLSRKWQ